MSIRNTYRSKVGCCICGLKSSASRFSNYEKIVSKLEEPDNLRSNKLSGDICNACSLYIKREMCKKSGNSNSTIKKGKLNTKSLNLSPAISSTLTRNQVSYQQNSFYDINMTNNTKSPSKSLGTNTTGAHLSSSCSSSSSSFGKCVAAASLSSSSNQQNRSRSSCVSETLSSDDTQSMSSCLEQHSVASEHSIVSMGASSVVSAPPTRRMDKKY